MRQMNKKGLSLIELLICIGLLGLIAMAGTSMISTSIEGHDRVGGRSADDRRQDHEGVQGPAQDRGVPQVSSEFDCAVHLPSPRATGRGRPAGARW